MKNKCYIYGAGEMFLRNKPDETCFVIAADGGNDYLSSCGIVPDLIVGDFDSAKKIPDTANVTFLPRIKDDTDMIAAVKLGFEHGFTEFHIFGGTGGRIDHTIANISILSYIAINGGNGYLYDKNQTMTVIKNDTISFSSENKGYVSAFSISDVASGVYEKGLKYTLENAVLIKSMPIGVSNEFLGTPSEISVSKGELLIIWES